MPAWIRHTNLALSMSTNSNHSRDESRGEAGPDNFHNGRFSSLKAEFCKAVKEIVCRQNKRLLEEHRAMKPLLSTDDLATTLNVSKRTVEKIIAEGKIRPLWIRGQRRYHPDTVAAYLRSHGTKRQ